MFGVFCGLVPGAFAQGMGGSPKDAVGLLPYLFGKGQAFTATSITTVQGGPSGRDVRMEASYAVSDGKVRTEMDMAKTMPQGAEQMKKMGMDRMLNIMRPDKGVAYMIYPGLKAYCETPLADAPAKADAPAPKVERTELGKETVDGHPCVKKSLVVTTADGKKMEGLTWEATDLGNIVIQSQMKLGNGTATMLLTDVKVGTVEDSLFDVPEGFQKHANMQELMMGAMSRMTK